MYEKMSCWGDFPFRKEQGGLADPALYRLVLHAIVAKGVTPDIGGDSKIRIVVVEASELERLQHTGWGLELAVENTQVEDKLMADFEVEVSVSVEPVTRHKAYQDRDRPPVSAVNGAELGLHHQWSW
jgi:hypothetical protein